eukprot:COSAG01_NODE_292_length_19376_cov_61.487239_18_plen_349_part_00
MIASAAQAIWQVFRESREAMQKATPMQGSLPQPQIAVFFDERASLAQPTFGIGVGSYGMAGMSNQILHMGAPARMYYMDDVPIVDVASIRLAVFINAYTPSKAAKVALAHWQKNASINTTFLFYGPAGLVQSELRDYPVTDCATDVNAVPLMTGIPELTEYTNGTTSQVVMKASFTAAEKAAFPGIEALAGIVYGSPGTFSPLMTVRGAPSSVHSTGTVIPLGNYAVRSEEGASGVPALIARARAGGGYNVYSASNRAPSTLLNAFARASGAHIYCDGRDCGVQAQGNVIFVQAIGPTTTTTRNGTRVVSLPKPLVVTNEAGTKVCATPCTTFGVDLQAGHSALFFVE